MFRNSILLAISLATMVGCSGSTESQSSIKNEDSQNELVAPWSPELISLEKDVVNEETQELGIYFQVAGGLVAKEDYVFSTYKTNPPTFHVETPRPDYGEAILEFHVSYREANLSSYFQLDSRNAKGDEQRYEASADGLATSCDAYASTTCTDLYQPTTCEIVRFGGIVEPAVDVVGSYESASNDCQAIRKLKIMSCKAGVAPEMLEFECDSSIDP